MTKFYVSCDEEDETLGSYFLKCKQDIESFLQEKGFNDALNFIHSRHCTAAFLEATFTGPNVYPLLFIAYGHGNRDRVKGRYGQYIEVGVSTSFFSNSFFYTNACLCGNNLADELLKDGALTFVGYKDEIASLKEEYEDISIKCDNSGLQAFISEDVTIKEAVEKMKSYYTYHINRIHDNHDPFRASLLVHARESLILKGNDALKFSDLVYDVDQS